MHISISSSSQQAYALQVTSDETEHVNVYTTQELKAFHTHFVVPLTRSCVAVPGGYTHPLLKQLVFKLPEFGNIEEWVALLSALPLELQSTVEFNSFFLNKPPPTPAKDRNGLHPGKLILRSDRYSFD